MEPLPCRSDAFCRCPSCKPPLPFWADRRRLPSNRLLVGSTGLAFTLLLMAAYCRF